MIEKAKDTCERWEAKTAAAGKATDKAVRGHPYRALGITLGMGVLIGLLAALTRRD